MTAIVQTLINKVYSRKLEEALAEWNAPDFEKSVDEVMQNLDAKMCVMDRAFERARDTKFFTRLAKGVATIPNHRIRRAAENASEWALGATAMMYYRKWQRDSLRA